MLREITMPKFGQTVEEATVETWHRAEGDAVEKGQPLLDITTDKATLEVEAIVGGTLQKRLYAEGDVVPVTAVIAFIGDEPVSDALVEKALARNATLAQEAKAPAAEPAPAPAAPSLAAPVAATSAPPMPAAFAPATAVAAPPLSEGRLFASPRARRVARERDIPLEVLGGTGPDGRIVEADVLAYAEQIGRLRVSATARVVAAERGVDLTRVRGSGVDGRIMRADVLAAPAAPKLAFGQRVALTPMRRIVAERLTFSKQTTPHFYLTADVDMTEAARFRAERNAAGGPKCSFNDLLTRAVALAFAEVPQMNVAWADGALVYRREVHIGQAVALDDGLIVPVVRHCERKSLAEITEATTDLVARARTKKLGPDDYEGGGLTISNLGMFGIDTVAPIINPGEVAILGVGRIAPKPVVRNDAIQVRQMTTLVLACDHRIVDGAIGARFLKALKDALESPDSLA